jgi:hypothetical protein
MNAIDHQSTPVETNWKKHMHSLPNPDIPTPPWFEWIRVTSKVTILFTAGMLAIVIGGGIIGLLCGIGPDHTGGTIYMFLGMILNLSIGLLRFYFNRHRGISIGNCRIRFYSFTAATWVICFTQFGKWGVLYLR